MMHWSNVQLTGLIWEQGHSKWTAWLSEKHLAPAVSWFCNLLLLKKVIALKHKSNLFAEEASELFHSDAWSAGCLYQAETSELTPIQTIIFNSEEKPWKPVCSEGLAASLGMSAAHTQYNIISWMFQD